MDKQERGFRVVYLASHESSRQEGQRSTVASATHIDGTVDWQFYWHCLLPFIALSILQLVFFFRTLLVVAYQFTHRCETGLHVGHRNFMEPTPTIDVEFGPVANHALFDIVVVVELFVR